METQPSKYPSRELFKSYKDSPKLAVPTTVLFLVVTSALIASWYSALTGSISLWAGCIANGLLTYWMFSVVHDSSHRAISSNKWLNDGMGTVGLLFMFPYAPMPVLRWLHMQHHRFTNANNDPDEFTHRGARWWAPLRWSFFDAYYIYYFFRYGGEFVTKFAKTFALYLGIVIPAAAAAIYFGYGLELLVLWFIPTRIALFLIDIVFVVLPHHPAMVTQEENPYMATTMRMGWEWLLTPLMVYQNYHLIHHLYPTIPFYKMHKAWYLKYDELNRHDVSFQSAFAMQPENMQLHKEFHNRTA